MKRRPPLSLHGSLSSASRLRCARRDRFAVEAVSDALAAENADDADAGG
jgi:hypothetical protein